MSGGHFDYKQNHIRDIAEEVAELIETNDSTEKNQWGEDKGYHFSTETIAKFKEGLTLLRKAQVAAQRIDWLVSGDDGEDSFHQRWEEDMAELDSRDTETVGS